MALFDTQFLTSLQPMKPRLFKKNQEIEILIEDYAFGGVGVGKFLTESGHFAVFVQNAIPGQLVKARVEKCDQRYAECKLIEVLTPSPFEVSTPYQPIPGAPFASLPVEKQEQFKKQSTLELFKRIGKVKNIESLFDEFVQAPQTWHYRNKMEYSFSVIRYDLESKTESDDFALGFKHRGTWWIVENLDKDSGMFDSEFESNLHIIRKWLEDTSLPAWHPPKRHGFYRFLVVRKSFLTNQLLVNLVTSVSHLSDFDINSFCEKMKEVFGKRLAGLIHTINPDIGDRVDPLTGSTHLIYGEPKIVEEILGLKFEISMQSFFQTNPKCAERLYSKVLQYAGINLEDDGLFTMDLFCGTGTITQLLARESKRKVIGVDIVDEAIDDARENAKRNSIERVEFYAADVGKFLIEYPQYLGRIATVVLDPPRGGIAPKTLLKVLALGAESIVYVSCNPATQARDTIAISEAGYSLKKISLVDQFPHTSHIETVALFDRK